MNARALLVSFIIVLINASSVSARNNTLVVLSSDLSPYKEALTGFQEELNQPSDQIRLSEGLLHVEGQPRVIVAIGGKATHEKYPDGSVLIYCMAPGTFVGITDHSGLSVQVSMMPEPIVLLAKLKEIQPSLKRLAVLWSSPAFENYARGVAHQGPPAGVEIQAERLAKPEDLPGRLRDLKNHVDALWLPPDPLLLNSADIVIITQFALLNHVPLYTAVTGLTEKGAVASISSTYRDIGRAAGRAARETLSGKVVSGEIYPSAITLTVNRQSAAKIGMELPKNLPNEVQRASP